MSRRPIDEVINDHAEEIMAIPGVVSLRVGTRRDGSPCIKVQTDGATPEIEERIPRFLDGYAVVVEEAGRSA